MSCDSFARQSFARLAPAHAAQLQAVYDQPAELKRDEQEGTLRAEALLLVATLRSQGLKPPGHLNITGPRSSAYIKWGRVGVALRALSKQEEGVEPSPSFPSFASFDELTRRVLVVEGHWLTTLTPDHPDAFTGGAYRTMVQASGHIDALAHAGQPVPEEVQTAAAALRALAATPAASKKEKLACIEAAAALAGHLITAGEQAGVWRELEGQRPRTRYPREHVTALNAPLAAYAEQGKPVAPIAWAWARQALRHASMFDGNEHLAHLADTLTPENWQEARLQAARRKSAASDYTPAWWAAQGAAVALHSAALAAHHEARREVPPREEELESHGSVEEYRRSWSRRIASDAAWCYKHALEAAWAVGDERRTIEQAGAALLASATDGEGL